MQYPKWYIEQQAMIKWRDMERLYNKASAIADLNFTNDHFIIKDRDYEEYVDANIAWTMEIVERENFLSLHLHHEYHT